ncbi:MFS transporter [Bacillaceae bacterium Marseille-Q3522]|nr:MFS transporter [Bacillaceae bacterium Marseille-Q3522]
MRKSGLLKFSLLSISLVLTSAGAISASIPLMLEKFTERSVASVELLVTVPAAAVVIFVLLSSFISSKIGEKQTVILGLLVALISGVIPIFSDNYAIVFASRLGLGAGFGLFNSLAVSLIGKFYTGDERAKLIGFQSAFQGLGSAAMTFVAGQLLNFGWQASFSVYLIIVPILVLFFLFVPKPDNENGDTEQIGNKGSSKTNFKVIGLSIFLFCMIIVYNAVSLKLPLYVTENHISTASMTGTVLSFMQLASMFTGFVFGAIYKKIHRFTLPASLIVMGISYILILLFHNIFLIGLGAIITGISFSLFVPYLFNQVNVVSPVGSETFNTSILIVGANVGGTVAPYGLSILSKLVPVGDINSSIYASCAIILCVIGGIGTLIAAKKSSTRKKELFHENI